MVYMLIFVFSVFISSVSQILLKKSANRKYNSKLDEYLNPRVIIAYGLFFSASLITAFAYKYVPLSLGTILESSGYVFVTVMGIIFLKERMGKKKLMGMTLILFGILVFYNF